MLMLLFFSELDYSDKKLLVEINKEESNPKGFPPYQSDLLVLARFEKH